MTSFGLWLKRGRVKHKEAWVEEAPRYPQDYKNIKKNIISMLSILNIRHLTLI